MHNVNADTLLHLNLRTSIGLGIILEISFLLKKIGVHISRGYKCE